MTANLIPSKWCGQNQPHDPHRWADSSSFYADCAGHSLVVAPGPCWDDSGHDGPAGDRFRCELLAGHAGAHECDRGSWGGKATWPTAPAPRPSTDPTGDTL